MARNKGQEPEQPPVKYCPVKGCGKKMRAFKRGHVWKYMCEDVVKHDQERIAAKAAGGSTGRGGVKKGTPSPRRGEHKGWRRVRRPRKDEGGK